MYASGIERDFMEHPILEPSFLYGANPPAELLHKLLMAKECDALPPVGGLPARRHTDDPAARPFEEHGGLPLGGRRRLSGGLPVRSGDAGKYQISFLVDVRAYLHTLETVRHTEARLLIPAHAEPTEEIASLGGSGSHSPRPLSRPVDRGTRQNSGACGIGG